VFDDERVEDRHDRQLLDLEGGSAEGSDEAFESTAGDRRPRTRRFSRKEAKRRFARRVKPRSIALAPPPPGP
jgi:hypothetical protein